MPYSDPRFDKQIKEFIKRHNFKSYLDVGPGAGKYGKMIRSLFPKAKVEAVEVESRYINKFGLKRVYNRVFKKNIVDFIDDQPDYRTDLAIVGDCIEHLKKSDGIDLINYLAYRTRFILIIFPDKYIQYTWKGHVSEAHRSVWSEKDFANFNIRHYRKSFMRLVIMKGYIGDGEAIVNPNAT